MDRGRGTEKKVITAGLATALKTLAVPLTDAQAEEENWKLIGRALAQAGTSKGKGHEAIAE